MSLDTAIYLLAGVILTFFISMFLFAMFWNRFKDWWDGQWIPYVPPHLDEQGLPEEPRYLANKFAVVYCPLCKAHVSDTDVNQDPDGVFSRHMLAYHPALSTAKRRI